MKRAYQKPSMEVFSLYCTTSLLAGSDIGGEQQAAPQSFNGESYDTNDIMEDGDASLAW